MAVAAPKGTLAQTLSQSIDDSVTSDTLHSLFMYSDTPDMSKHNWSVGQYDIVFIDEVSQISVPLFSHIMCTLSKLFVRPRVVLSGDFAQQQPIAAIDTVTKEMPNISKNPTIMEHIVTFELPTQFRCTDNELLHFQEKIRLYRPTESDLSQIMHGKVLLTSDTSVSSHHLNGTIKDFPSHLVLTMTNAAARTINIAIVEHQFQNIAPLCTSAVHDGHDYPIYKSMKLMITQNCNKAIGCVNGQFVTVVTTQHATIVVRPVSGQFLALYPVSDTTTGLTCYPCIPAYACTIAKMQGQTLDNVILWVDTDSLPCATAYVAMSRVRTLQSLKSLKVLYPITCHHFHPMTLQ